MSKNKLVLSLALILVVVAGVIVWQLPKKTKTVNNQTPLTNQVNTVKTDNTLASNNASTNIVQTDLVKQKAEIKDVNQEFLDKVPSANTQELESFSKVALGGDMEQCERNEKTDSKCKYYFALYKKNEALCADIADQTLKLDCYKKLVFGSLQTKFDKCNTEKNTDLKINCLNNLFWAISDVKTCEMFTSDFIYQSCVDSRILNTAISKNKKDCSGIKDSAIKDFCDNYFLSGDFDKDGLIDAEELKIGTNPYVADTDHDGVSDKDEVTQHLNPCGDGKMPEVKALLENCSKFKK